MALPLGEGEEGRKKEGRESGPMCVGVFRHLSCIDRGDGVAVTFVIVDVLQQLLWREAWLFSEFGR